MNPLQLEEITISSFSSSSTVHTTGSTSAGIHICSVRFLRRKSHRLENQTDVPLLHTDR